MVTNLPLTQRLALTEAWQTPVSASSNWTPRLGWWVARSTVQPGAVVASIAWKACATVTLVVHSAHRVEHFST